MKEAFLHHLWKFKLLGSNKFESVQNDQIEILNFGQHNLHSGPDFSNAKIRINGYEIAGHIEFHLKSSDWYAHGHQNDRAYDNVILHVVQRHDKYVKVKGANLPEIEIDHLIDEGLKSDFSTLISKDEISCSKLIPTLKPLDWIEQSDRMSIERIERKLKLNEDLFEQTGADFDTLFHLLLGRTLGGRVNQEGFDLLNIRLKTVQISKLNQENYSFESLILGLSGYLTNEYRDEYPKFLQSEWQYLKVLFGLEELLLSVWKYGRVRPSGFPQIRLIQFASLIMMKKLIFAEIEKEHTVNEWLKLLNVNFNKYWQEHAKLDGPKGRVTFSKAMRISILINVILPIRNIIRKRKGLEFISYHQNILENIKAEKNSITKKWEALKVENENIYHSQALIELYNEYCQRKQCLNCKFGVKFMAR